MRNGNHKRVKNDSKSICHFFIYAFTQVHFMVEKDLLSPNLVVITLAEQTSKQSRKQGDPQAAPLQHLPCRGSCSQIILTTRKVLFGLCSPPTLGSSGDSEYLLYLPVIYSCFLPVAVLLLSSYFFTYISLYLFLTGGKRWQNL